MNDQAKSKKQLLEEVAELRQSIAKLEQELRESEKRFRETVDLLPTIVVEYDLEGLITYVNDYGYDMLGYSPSDVEKGYRIRWLLPTDEVEKHMHRLGRLIKGGKVPGAEYQLLRKDGSTVHALITSAPIYKEGKIVGIRSTATDISDRKKAEDALKESEGRFRMLVESMRDALGVQDENGIITYVNQRVCELTGYSRDKLIGRPATDLLEEPYRGVYAEEFAKRRDGMSSTYELTWTGKDGRKITTISSSAPIFDLEGNFKGSFGVFTDITERKRAEDALRESEEKFRALFDHMPTMAFVIDREHRLIAGNAAFAEKMGDQANRTTLELSGVLRAAREFWYGIEKQVINSGRPTWYTEVAESRNQGRTFIECRKQPVKDQDGKVTMVVGIATDITGYVKDQITLAEEVRELRIQISKEAGPTIIGKSKKISEALGRVRAIAGTDTTVLITGESGSGKELVAEAIHNLSKRAKKPLIKVNCAALPESIIESELFGHTKGAFTGAVSNRIGRFEAAHGGTIFLDEIGDVSPGVQVRLLRVLEERKIERVGDYRPIQVDVRIIAATNQNLRSLVEKGRFREDLFYRLNVFNIHMPPLRERTEDIPLLVAHFIKECSREMGKEIRSISDEAMSSLLQHNWQGNVRELMNVIESACVLCAGNTIQTEHLPPISEVWTTTVEATSDKDIREALRLTRGNKAKAARLLGIHRSTLYRRMERYGIATE